MTNIIAIAVAACFAVESTSGIDKRTGDSGRAVGVYQMWPIAVREVNRVWKTRYTYADRCDEAKAKRMCELTMLYHYLRGVKNPVDLACRWRNPHGDAPWKHRRKIKRAVKTITANDKVVNYER